MSQTLTPRPKSYGLVRASTMKQDKSPEMQARDIAQLASTLDAEFMGCIDPDRGVSATKVRLFKRPAMRKLEAIVQPGDHLIIWRFDRMVRSIHDASDLVEFLTEGELHLQIVQQSEGELDPRTENGNLMMWLYSMMGSIESMILKKRVRASVEDRKAKGEAHCAQKRYGYTREKIRGRWYYIWNQHEWDQMYEIYVRHRRGESFQKIRNDFHRRKLRMAGGVAWAPERSPRADRFERVYKYFVKSLEKGIVSIVNNQPVEVIPSEKELVEEVRKKAAGAEENNNGPRVLARV